MQNKYKIIFMGTPEFAKQSLEMLCKNEYTPIAVFTKPDKINGRNGKITFSPVKLYSLEQNIPIHQPTTLKDESQYKLISEYKPDIIVVIAYGKILPENILRIPKYGAINVHASLLPKYRGAAPIQRAIINGETKTGITIMKLDKGMDTGDIISQKEIPISQESTAENLFEILAKEGSYELVKVLNDLERKLSESIAQNEGEATYAEKITKSSGHINWNLPANTIHNLIRGMYPNPGTYTFFRKKRIKLHKSNYKNVDNKNIPSGTIISLKDDIIHVSTGKGVLEIYALQPENHKCMSSRDFINGYQIKINEKFEY